MSDSAVITGIGAVTALGMTAEATFEALCAGKTAIGPIRDMAPTGFACPVAARMAPIDPESLGLRPRDSRTMGLHTYSMLVACRAAFAQAGLGDDRVPREKIAFFAGLGTVDYRPEDLSRAVGQCLREDGSVDYEEFFGGAYHDIHPLWPLCMLNNIAHSQVAIDLDVRGDNATFSPHAEAGAQAIREAQRCLSAEGALAALAVGVGEEVTPQSLTRHGRLGWLSQSGDPRPFSRSADGGVLGEAAATLVLGEPRSVRSLGKTPLAQVAGYAMRVATRREPEAYREAIANAMTVALEESRIYPDEVAAVFANGDGRPVNDAAEARAILDILGDGAPVTTTKPGLGVTLAAAGVVDTVMAALALQRGMVPPCRGVSIESDMGLNIVTAEARPLQGAAILVNTQGLAGQCASIVIRAVEE